VSRSKNRYPGRTELGDSCLEVAAWLRTFAGWTWTLENFQVLGQALIISSADQKTLGRFVREGEAARRVQEFVADAQDVGRGILLDSSLPWQFLG
jgi:hypothetical protein